MKWDSKYVRTKYALKMLGQDCIFYPCKNARRLVVSFSSMGSDRYDRYSWFWEESEVWNETAYLFIKDDTFRYFLGDDDRPLSQTFRKIILYAMEQSNVSEESVFTIGGSMGGYAAIYYAIFMGLNGAITSNPQLDYASTRAHEYQNWERNIRKTGTQWYDLSEFIFKFKKLQIFILSTGTIMQIELQPRSLLTQSGRKTTP